MNNYVTFVLRDSKEIYGVFLNIDTAYNTLLQLIHTHYKYYKVESIATCNIELMVRSFQILEYDFNVINNLYVLKHDFCLYDSKNKLYVSNKISISDYTTKLNMLRSEEKYACDDMDIFLPIEDTDVRPSNNEERELKVKLQLLSEAKEVEEQKLRDLKVKVKPIASRLIKQVQSLNTETRRLNEDKKLRQEKYQKFLVDKNVFLRMEKEMIDGKRIIDDVPEIFTTYSTFKLMRQNNIFDLPDNEMFDYFLEHIERNNFFSGNYNSLFDAPDFAELKQMCLIDEYDTDSTVSDDVPDDVSEDVSDDVSNVDLKSINTENFNTNNYQDDNKTTSNNESSIIDSDSDVQSVIESLSDDETLHGIDIETNSLLDMFAKSMKNAI